MRRGERAELLKILMMTLVMMALPLRTMAQIGEHRNELAIGFNAGYTLSNVGFTPSIQEGMLGNVTAGLSFRYTCEKYFTTVCAIVAELNLSKIGWKEDILDSDDQPVINSVTGVAEEFERELTYVQLPLMARLGWGRERKGVQGFFQVGPQIGYYISDKKTANFDFDDRNTTDRVGAMQEAVNDTLEIQNKLDYGIVGGAGIEFSHPKIGHFILEGRYYYGLGDIFKNSKSDYFGRSNNNIITIKLTWLFDIVRSKNDKIR